MQEGPFARLAQAIQGHSRRVAAGSLIGVCVVVSALASCSATSTSTTTTFPIATKIKHVIIIMQENRSFDSYFGTYPGADGIPMQNGVPTVCVNDPATNTCVKPYYNPNDLNGGGPHGAVNATADINGGQMNGFIAQAEKGRKGCLDTTNPVCTNSKAIDVMGWHDARQIPNYWTYAKDFVLQDHMFEPDASWSLPAHLFLVSAWSAYCSQPGVASSCVNNIAGPVTQATINKGQADYAWTDLTYLMHKDNVSWGYYLSDGSQPDCADDQELCTQKAQKVNVPGIWNPLPSFDTVKQDNQLGNIQEVSNYFTQAKNGTLPEVSWIVPDGTVS